MTTTDDLSALTDTLRRLGVIARHDHARRAEIAGDGNMNVTRRVWTGAGTVIVKQAPPYVARYPSIAAPPERAEVEGAFFAAVAREPHVASRVPRVLGADPTRHLLVLEDLGVAADCVDLYDGVALAHDELDALIAWLRALHALPTGPLPAALANRAMRTLNHEHVFVLPFGDRPPLPLDDVLPGLEARSRAVRTDPRVRARAATLGARYLADGDALLHGDFYPASWLRTDRGLQVIDAEFAFVGDTAFDWGVLLAHLVLARQDESLVRRVCDAAPDGTRGYAGIEVMRRLLGVAQLTLGATLDERVTMLERARDWVVAS